MSRRVRAGVLAAVLLLIGQAACTHGAYPVTGESPGGPHCRAPAHAMVRLELVFGLSRPGGGTVSEAEWAQFLDGEVTPRFPAGLTVLDGLGQWQGDDGRVAREASRLLIVFHEPDGRTEADVEAIRAAYKRRFDQESVMRVDSVSCVSF